MGFGFSGDETNHMPEQLGEYHEQGIQRGELPMQPAGQVTFEQGDAIGAVGFVVAAVPTRGVVGRGDRRHRWPRR